MINSIKNNLRGLYQGRFDPENIQVMATTYWRVILVCNSFVLVAVCAYATWQFLSIQDDLSIAPAAPAQLDETYIDRTALHSVLEVFTARGAQYDSLKTTEPVVLDPSR